MTPATATANWFSSMSPRERKTFWACFFGWAIDAMDVQIYAVVMPTLISLWALSRGQAGMLGTSALLVSSLGGWLAGILADRIGRARVLRITIVWFAAFTFLSGFTNSYGQLLATRALQGLGFGGEWAAGAVLIGEVINKRVRGRAVGSVQGGWSLGYGAAVLLFTVLFSVAEPKLAWRLLFWIGSLPALIALWYCRNLEEPEVFSKALFNKAKRSAPGTRQPSHFLDIFRPPLLGTTLIACLLATGVPGGNYTILTWLPTYLKTVRHLSVLNTGGYLAVNITGSFFGYIISAHLSDWLGRRRTYVLTSICAIVTVAVYTLVPLGPATLLVLGFPLGFFQSGMVAGMGATFAELFPTMVRATGQGFSYNTGRAIGSAMPAIVGYLSVFTPLGQAVGLCALSSYALVLVATALLPETRGKELAAHV
jgi:MFS family permease